MVVECEMDELDGEKVAMCLARGKALNPGPYRMPMALLGMLASLAVWEGVRYCRDHWALSPGIAQALLHCAQIATAILLYICNLQFALVYAIGLSYAVMMLHASLRKLTPSNLPDPGNKNRRAQPRRC